MNGLSYEVKRAHWRFTWMMIRVWERAARSVGHRRSVLTGMTPARYDILHSVYRRFQWMKKKRWGASRLPLIPFGTLVKKLGLSASTVSECVSRMVDLGLLRKKRADHDRRSVIVLITKLGIKAFHAAQRGVRLALSLVLHGLEQWPMPHAELRRGDAVPPEWEFLCTGTWDRPFFTIASEARLFARFFGSRADPIHAPDYVELYR